MNNTKNPFVDIVKLKVGAQFQQKIFSPYLAGTPKNFQFLLTKELVSGYDNLH